MRLPFAQRLLLCSTFIAASSGAALALPLPAAKPSVGRVSDASTVPLIRDRPGALSTAADVGALNDASVIPHVRLALTRPADRQAALDRLTRDQHTRGTADYRRWLVPAQLRAYGPAQADIDKVSAWLIGHRLHVNSVSPSGMSIDFGGRSGDIAAAFHTPLHHVAYKGEAHIANLRAPSIPVALAAVITGVTLSDFFPKPTVRRLTPNFTIPTSSTPYYAVGPADFATIYNINPLRGNTNFYGRPITGTGVSLAMIEQTQIQSADWNTFRKAAGLAKYKGTLTQINPECASPGFTGDEGEAALDAEWSSAVAPDANIIVAACSGMLPFEFGVMTTLMHLVEDGTPATIFSISYGGPEVANGFAFQAVWSNLLEEGAAEGKAIFVSTGDSGVSADRNAIASNGLFVNGLADTAYNVAVGGTDFYDTALGQNASYWHQRNGPGGSSAVSYIPEIPWNNSCASTILDTFLGSDAFSFCNSRASAAIVQNGVGGSGSQSQYYTKPDWQLTSVLGMPSDGVRDQPDVSLFAANGLWSHFYVFCMSDKSQGGAPCDYTNLRDIFGNAAGGTSFAAPAFAGITALIQQSIDLQFGPGVPLGNPNPAFYKIAQAQFTTPLGLSGCDSSLGNKISSACVFNDVTAGDINEPCYAGTPSCVTSPKFSTGVGVLGADVSGKHEFAYPAGRGYSLATGLGSVNVTNLLYSYYLGL